MEGSAQLRPALADVANMESYRSRAEAGRDSFVMTALRAYRHWCSGATMTSLSRAIQAELRDEKSLVAEVPSSLKWLTQMARVGRVLSLPGELPDGMGPRDLLALIKKLAEHKWGGVGKVDRVISRATTQEQVVAGLHLAIKRLRPPKVHPGERELPRF